MGWFILKDFHFLDKPVHFIVVYTQQGTAGFSRSKKKYTFGVLVTIYSCRMGHVLTENKMSCVCSS